MCVGGGVLSVGTKCIRCALICAVGQIWREIITRRKLPRRCCENSIATKLFGKQPTRAGRMHTRIDTAQDGYTNTHLASVACDVSCWRLVASLCRFARSLCVWAGGVLSVVSKCIHCARVCRWSNLEEGNHTQAGYDTRTFLPVPHRSPSYA